QGSDHAIRVGFALGLDHAVHLDQGGMPPAIHGAGVAPAHQAPDQHANISEAEQAKKNPPAAAGTLLLEPLQRDLFEHLALPALWILSLLRRDGDCSQSVE